MDSFGGWVGFIHLKIGFIPVESTLPLGSQPVGVKVKR